MSHADASIDRETLDQALDAIEAEASAHGANYAAGMRHARLIFEEAIHTPDQ